MNSLVSAITCTGHRPEAFELCKRYMAAQTYKGPLQWIVVHDEEGDFFSSKKPEDTFECYRGPKVWKSGLNTQRFNMEEAIKHVKGDYIFICEDDEWYSNTYIEKMLHLLQICDIVGESKSKYYNISLPGFKEIANTSHATLSQTAIRRSRLPNLEAAINSGEKFFDIHLWNQVHAQKIPYILTGSTNMVIGMKGLPGRAGLGFGHTTKDYLLDPSLVKLEEWLGPYKANYLPFINRMKHDQRNTNQHTTNRMAGPSTGRLNNTTTLGK